MANSDGKDNRMAQDFAAMARAMGTGTDKQDAKPKGASRLAGFKSKAPASTPTQKGKALSKSDFDKLRP